MNKKFLCGMLACAMALSSVFGITGCNLDEGNTGNGGGTNNGDINNGGGTGNGGTNNGDTGNNGNTTIKPGTVITDEGTKNELFGALSETELGGFTYSASANLSVTENGKAQTQKLLAEGAVLLTDSAVEADAYVAIEGVSDSEKVSQYYLAFLRDDAAYTAGGDYDDKEDVDFAQLKMQLKAKENPIILSKDDVKSGGAANLVQSPTVLKLVKNLPSLFEGVITKTEGGFSLAFDMAEAIESLLEGAESFAAAIDLNPDITLGGAFGQTFFKSNLEKLLNGITAKELIDTAKPYLPENVQSALPEAAENTTAAAYVETVLRSGAFYTALTGGEEMWKDFKTFAEVPLAAIVGIFKGGDFSFEGLKLKKFIHDLRDELESQVVSLLLSVLSLNGEVKDEEMAIVMTFSFDDDKKLLGFSLDGLLMGSVEKSEDSEHEENGDETPEDGEDEDEVSPTAKTKNEATARGSIKLEAACASAPELFDLKGCKYYGEEGGTATIK